MGELTWEMIKTAALVLVAVFGFYKIISEIVTTIGKYTKRKEKLEMLDPEKIKTELSERYDAEINEIKEELYLQSECTSAILSGLMQLHCNGPVTEAKQKLDQFINKRAHDIT